MSNTEKYDWVVVGGGIVGIIIAEILTREGYKVALVEKNEQLAGETTRDFHEWIHTGALYTLIPDKGKTMRFLLGAIDDLIEFYGGFKGMNLVPTEKGLQIADSDRGWFNKNYIHFHFRITNRKLTFPWVIGVSRAVFLLEKLKNHDWLRRRAGEFKSEFNYKTIVNKSLELLRYKSKFFQYKTSDFTTNSRNLLTEILYNAMNNGLKLSLNNPYISHTKDADGYHIRCEKESFTAENLVFASGKNIANLVDSTVKTSYAPMAVVSNIKADDTSFVELDYFPKNCINLLTKDGKVGLIGGISFNKLEECDPYIEEVIAKHKIYNPGLVVHHKYVGIKSEIILRGQPRNYLFHILTLNDGALAIIPGKFTLAFSIGPEFFRRIYKRNPIKQIKTGQTKYSLEEVRKFVSNTVWQDYQKENN